MRGDEWYIVSYIYIDPFFVVYLLRQQWDIDCFRLFIKLLHSINTLFTVEFGNCFRIQTQDLEIWTFGMMGLFEWELIHGHKLGLQEFSFREKEYLIISQIFNNISSYKKKWKDTSAVILKFFQLNSHNSTTSLRRSLISSDFKVS
jgi:hypothetical protein